MTTSTSTSTSRPPKRRRKVYDQGPTVPRSILAARITAAVQEEYGPGSPESLAVADAALAPFRPESVKVLDRWGRLGREWPSPETWKTVAVFLREFDIVVGHDTDDS